MHFNLTYFIYMDSWAHLDRKKKKKSVFVNSNNTVKSWLCEKILIPVSQKPKWRVQVAAVRPAIQNPKTLHLFPEMTKRSSRSFSWRSCRWDCTSDRKVIDKSQYGAISKLQEAVNYLPKVKYVTKQHINLKCRKKVFFAKILISTNRESILQFPSQIIALHSSSWNQQMFESLSLILKRVWDV